MKTIVVLMLALVSSPVFADCSPQFWQNVRRLADQCSPQNCRSIQVMDASLVRFELDGERYVAMIRDSEDSDGGDLNDVIAINESGSCIAKLHNVPAYGDPVSALRSGAETP